MFIDRIVKSKITSSFVIHSFCPNIVILYHVLRNVTLIFDTLYYHVT